MIRYRFFNEDEEDDVLLEIKSYVIKLTDKQIDEYINAIEEETGCYILLDVEEELD